MPSTGPYVVTLDVGTSSVRTLLFDSKGQEQPNFGEHRAYQITTDHGGVAEVNPDALLQLCADCLKKIHEQIDGAGIRPAALAMDTFWHSFLGIDQEGKPTTAIVHLFDTRSTSEAAELAGKLDAAEVHRRTGCRLHSSYWPAKLLWLSRYNSAACARTRHWLSFGEYLFLKMTGAPLASTSMISGTGLWDQVANAYDEQVLAALPIEKDQLPDPNALDQPASTLIEPYRTQWPLLHGIPWYPALGDGACSHIGSGCSSAGDFSLMVGTSGAMRAVVEGSSVSIPDGLWCYRVDRRRFILGGALSNGGDVYAWMRRTLALPPEADAEAELQKRAPGVHSLLMLPFFAGERSPYWRADLRAAIVGIDLATKPMDILQAGLESVSLHFRQIFVTMTESLGAPSRVIASGGALLASSAWTQMMADALGAPIIPCLEHEATSRGAALLAFERLGAITSVAVPFQSGPPRPANAANTPIYVQLQAAQTNLFDELFSLK